MIIGRIIGLILLLAAAAAVGYEVRAAFESGAWRPIALGEFWYKLHASSLNGAQAGIQRYIAPWLWEPVITTVLLWPAWAVFAVPGSVLAWACRRRRRRRRRRRE